jgi:hypothetical protein
MYLSQTINGKKILEVNIFSIFKASVLRLVNSLFKTKIQAGLSNNIDVLRFEISSAKMNNLLLNCTDLRGRHSLPGCKF